MSDGMFVAPIVTDDGRIIGWGRGPEMVAGAAHYRELGTDRRFLRYIDGKVVTISEEEQYRSITRTICQLAGVAVVDKFASVGAVADVVVQYGMGENAIQLTQYALFLKATLDELRRVDGDDAWERI